MKVTVGFSDLTLSISVKKLQAVNSYLSPEPVLQVRDLNISPTTAQTKRSVSSTTGSSNSGQKLVKSSQRSRLSIICQPAENPAHSCTDHPIVSRADRATIRRISLKTEQLKFLRS
ncbi:unnamed protein product [Pleuronectes platessa]|uniref:Uncharacterized protein n=1 Tax=Pleuronectes platessa TaxID=8262 RepID=A0A9N7TVW8_PLEPL|nr:unnamed protein product [Pleuronectes platessa]